LSTFAHGGGTVQLTRNGAQALTTSAQSFNNLSLTNAGTDTTTVTGALTVLGNLEIQANQTLAVGNNVLSVTGTTGNAGTITLGNALATLTGTVTNDGVISRTGGSATSSGAVTNNGTLSFTATAGAAWTVSGNFTSTGTITNTVANTMSVSGDVAISGTFNTPLSSTITMTGAGTTVNTAVAIGNLTTSGAAAVTAVGNALNLSGALTIGTGTSLSLAGLGATISGAATGAGTGTLNGGTAAVTINGDFTIPNYQATSGTTSFGGAVVTLSTFAHGGGTVQLTRNGAQALTTSAQSFNNLSLTNAGTDTTTVTGALTVLGNLEIQANQTLAVGANPVIISQNLAFEGGTLTSSGNVTVSGNFTRTVGGLNSTGTLTFTGVNVQAFNPAGSTFTNITVNKAANSVASSNVLVLSGSGDLTMTAGTLATGGFAVTVGGDLAFVDGILTNSGTVNLIGDLTQSGLGGLNSTGTLVLAGTGPQAVNFAFSTLSALSVVNPGGTVTAGSSLSVDTYTQSGAGGAFIVPALYTMTVTTAAGISAGTLDLTGAFTGGGATFTVNGGTVSVGTNAFVTGAMTVSSGSFTQFGINAGANTLASLLVNGGNCTWDSPAAGGTLTISGACTQTAGTIVFNNKVVTLGTGISGAFEFYDLIIPAGITLNPGLGSTITVRRSMTIQNTGNYSIVNNPTLILGGTSSAAGGSYADNNAVKVNLGNVTVSGAQSKSLATAMAVTNLTITGGPLAAGAQALTVSGNIDLNAGTLTSSGTVRLAGDFLRTAPGAATSTGTLEFTGIGAQTFNPTGSSFSTVFINKTGGSLSASASFSATTLNTAAANYGITLSGGLVTDLVTFSNIGTLTISGGFIFDGGAIATAPVSKNLAGIFQAIGADNLDFGTTPTVITANTILRSTGGGIVTLAGTTVNAGATLTLGLADGTIVNTGAIDGIAATSNLTINTTGIVTIGGAVGTTAMGIVTVTNSGGTTFQGTVNAATVTLTDTAGTIAFNDALSVTTGMSAAAGGFNLALNQAAAGQISTIAGLTTLANTGTLTLGNAATDTVNFTGGVSATSQTGATAITVYGAVNADGAGTVTLGDNDTPLRIASTASFGGASVGLVTLAPSGTVTIGDGFTLTLGNGAASKAFSTGSIVGVALGAASNLTINTTGAVTVGGAVGTDIATVTVTQSGGVTFQSTVNVPTLAIANTAAGQTVQVNDNLTVGTSMTVTGAGAYHVAILGAVNSIAGTTTFSNTGNLTVGSAGSATSFTVGAVKTTAGVRTFAGTISATNSELNFGGLGSSVIAQDTIFNPGAAILTLIATTVNDGRSLTLGTGAATTVNTGAITGAVANTANLTINTTGIVTIGGVVGATALNTVTVTHSGGTSFSGSVSAANLFIADTQAAQSVSIIGNLVLSGSILAQGSVNAYHVSFNGNVNTISGSGTFLNAGNLSLGDADTDAFTFTGGFTATATATNTIRGTIATGGAPGQNLTFDTFILAGATTLNAGANGNLVFSAPVTVPDFLAATDLSITAAEVDAGGTSLTIQASATVDLGSSGFDIQTLISDGTLRLTGLQATHVFTVFDTDSGVTEYYGTGAGSLVFTAGMAGGTYWDLRIAGSGAGVHSLQGAITVNNDLHIQSGVLDVTVANNYALNVAGNWRNDVGFTGFLSRAGTVVFNKAAGTIEIRGNNTWFVFECLVPGITIEFENTAAVITQRIASGGIFRVRGALGFRSTLNRLTDNGIPGTPPAEPFDDNRFWFFDLTPGATMDLDYIDIFYSNARTNPLNVPFVVDSTHVVATPYAIHYCYKWLDIAYAIYSYTEDSDYNGKIDRIRVTTETNINLAAGQFNGFTVEVFGYTVIGYDLPMSGRNFYILLQEKPYLDTSVTPDWRILTNTTLVDAGGKFLGTVSRADDGNPATDESRMTPGDSAWPIIGYTLAIPAYPKAFIHLSEAVVTSADLTPLAGDLGFTGSLNPITVLGNGIREAEGDFAAQTTADLVAIATSINLTPTMKDQGTPPYWEPAYAGLVIGYPQPTYPPATGYTANPNVYVGFGPSPDIVGPVLPTRPAFELQRGGSIIPKDPTQHRVSDLLISVPPTPTVIGSWSELYLNSWFIWPIWARDSGYLPGDITTFEPLTPAESANITVGLVRAFDGSQWLRDQDILVQSRTYPLATPGTPTMMYDSNVAANLVSAVPGIWLPPYAEPDFSGLAAYPNELFPVGSSWSQASTSIGGDLWNNTFLASNDKIYDRAVFEFWYRLDGSLPATDLYAGRLDVPPGFLPAEFPPNWYRLVRPFGFSIRDIQAQRSGVSILNNVIDPTRGERTRLNYIIDEEGPVTITVFTLDGDVVQTLQRGRQSPGDYTVNWNGRNRAGNSVARGIYFIRIVAPGIDEIRKVMVVKN
jgi:hypothetical protein